MNAPFAPSRADRSIRRHVVGGFALCLLLFGVAGGWAATSNLAGAVIAPAMIVVDTNLKKVQHLTGGVVGEIRVRDGASVEAGDVVMRLDETVTRANLGIVTRQIDELGGRRARLIAERDLAGSIAFPADLLARAGGEPDIAAILHGERLVFDARRSARVGQKAQLRERIAASRQELEGLAAQLASTDKQNKLIVEELKGVEDLFRRNLVPVTRISPLQREAARLEGARGQIVASAAQGKAKIAETELQIIQIDADMRTEVLRELREIDGKLAELGERKIAAEDQLKRIDIRAPQAGIVHQLSVNTVGGVIAAGETVMLIVPQSEALGIEGKVAPQDIDQVAAGQPAVVRLSALNARTTPELMGTITRVSAELTKDPQTGASHFTVRVDLPRAELDRLGPHRLVPGMPAEVHIQTGERMALSYLLKPLTDQFARTFKER